MGVAGDEGASTVLTVTSTGTAAVYYSWTNSAEHSGRKGDERDEEEEEEGRGEGSTSSPQTPQQQQASSAATVPTVAQFYLRDRTGVILPGETREFVFSFRSPAAGIYADMWQMATIPPLPAMSMRHHTCDPVEVSLRGVAVPQELGQAEVARLRLEAGMARRERDRQVRLVWWLGFIDACSPPKDQPIICYNLTTGCSSCGPPDKRAAPDNQAAATSRS